MFFMLSAGKWMLCKCWKISRLCLIVSPLMLWSIDWHIAVAFQWREDSMCSTRQMSLDETAFDVKELR